MSEGSEAESLFRSSTLDRREVLAERTGQWLSPKCPSLWPGEGVPSLCGGETALQAPGSASVHSPGLRLNPSQDTPSFPSGSIPFFSFESSFIIW